LLDGHTRDDRNAVLDRVKEAINRAGWLVDFTLFSNTAAALAFELELGMIPTLRSGLVDTGLHLGEKSRQALDELEEEVAGLSDEQRRSNLVGLMHITFVHDEPDLRREVPRVPG